MTGEGEEDVRSNIAVAQVGSFPVTLQNTYKI